MTKGFQKRQCSFEENSRIFQASEKIHFIESDDQNRTRSSKIERSIFLEMNKTDFWSVNSE